MQEFLKELVEKFPRKLLEEYPKELFEELLDEFSIECLAEVSEDSRGAFGRILRTSSRNLGGTRGNNSGLNASRKNV